MSKPNNISTLLIRDRFYECQFIQFVGRRHLDVFLKRNHARSKIDSINAPPNSVLLYVDEKRPIKAKTHGDTSWSSTQVKVKKP